MTWTEIRACRPMNRETHKNRQAAEYGTEEKKAEGEWKFCFTALASEKNER